jgi:hypothetical protein
MSESKLGGGLFTSKSNGSTYLTGGGPKLLRRCLSNLPDPGRRRFFRRMLLVRSDEARHLWDDLFGDQGPLRLSRILSKTQNSFGWLQLPMASALPRHFCASCEPSRLKNLVPSWMAHAAIPLLRLKKCFFETKQAKPPFSVRSCWILDPENRMAPRARAAGTIPRHHLQPVITVRFIMQPFIRSWEVR